MRRADLDLVDDGRDHRAGAFGIRLVAVHKICRAMSAERLQRRNTRTFKTVVFRALHALLECVEADVVIDFEASMQVVEGEAGVEHCTPLGRAVAQKRLLLRRRHESTEVDLSEQRQSEENAHQHFKRMGNGTRDDY